MGRLGRGGMQHVGAGETWVLPLRYWGGGGPLRSLVILREWEGAGKLAMGNPLVVLLAPGFRKASSACHRRTLGAGQRVGGSHFSSP